MFRPFGNIEWVLSCSSEKRWALFGSINSESRSLEAPRLLSELGILDSTRILKILWPVSPHSDVGEKLTEKNIGELKDFSDQPLILERDLLAPITHFHSDAHNFGLDSVILDITSMPKRFFFFYLKSLLNDGNVKNLIITYCAGRYKKGPLSGNSEDWDVLPSFRGGDREDEELARSRLIVNVGFMPGGLQEHLRSDDAEQDLFLILPIPARASTSRRVWDSAMKVGRDWNGNPSAVHFRRNPPNDMSGAFDLIKTTASGGAISLAPFGPKPISAAMCLFATLSNSPVYYAQPKWYEPDYTKSAQVDDQGCVDITAYWIKHDGESLYSF